MMVRKRRENLHVIKRSPQQQPNPTTPITTTTGTVDGLTEQAATSDNNKNFFRPILPPRSSYNSASGSSNNDTESNDLRRTLEKSGMRLIEEVEWVVDDGNYHYYQ